MSANFNNRPPIQVRIGTIDGDKTYIVFVATTKCRIHKALITDQTAIVASESEFIEFQLEAATVAVGSAVDTKAGLGALAPLAIEVAVSATQPYIELEAGEALELVADITTRVTTDSILSLDVEVIGNDVI